MKNFNKGWKYYQQNKKCKLTFIELQFSVLSQQLDLFNKLIAKI